MDCFSELKRAAMPRNSGTDRYLSEKATTSSKRSQDHHKIASKKHVYISLPFYLYLYYRLHPKVDLRELVKNGGLLHNLAGGSQYCFQVVCLCSKSFVCPSSY